jgi:hypothetical protein
MKRRLESSILVLPTLHPIPRTLRESLVMPAGIGDTGRLIGIETFEPVGIGFIDENRQRTSGRLTPI